MGSVTYDFLNSSLLFDVSLHEENFRSVAEQELRAELENYRQHVLSHFDQLAAEFDPQRTTLRVLSDRDDVSIKRLMQTALYLEQVILPDPIFPFTHRKSELSTSMGQFLGLPAGDEINRRSLAGAASRMKAMTPMIAADYVKFLPISYQSEPPDALPVTYSATGFADVLSADVGKKYLANVQVRSLSKKPTGWILDEELNIGRAIAIEFVGDDGNMHIYNLAQQRVVKLNEQTRVAHFEISLPDEPPTKDHFDAWVSQSINQAAIAHFEQLRKGVSLASSIGASFLTRSEFCYSLLGSQPAAKDIRSYTADRVLNMEVPFLEDVDMADLMSIRMNDGEEFALFRLELERKFMELRTESDPDQLQMKVENIVHELTEIETGVLDKKIKHIRRGALGSAVVAMAGLAGSVATSGLSLVATVVALANGYSTYAEYREKVRSNPSYFLWKVKDSATR